MCFCLLLISYPRIYLIARVPSAAQQRVGSTPIKYCLSSFKIKESSGRSAKFLVSEEGDDEEADGFRLDIVFGGGLAS